ncbi:MAG: two-component regulator propeller domain-containing protein [Candidatus Krumholzibacteriia bacterium]
MIRVQNKKATCAVIGLCLLAASAGATAAQQGAWQSHVDPSLISGIVLRNGELYIASNGGLLIFTPADSSFDQFTSVSGLPSNFLTALVFDNAGSLWVGTENSGVAEVDFVAAGIDVRPLTRLFNGLADDRITSLTAWGDTIVYGSKVGAGLIVQGFPGQRFFAGNGLPSDEVNAVLADGDRVWIATMAGVAFLDDLGFITEFSNGLPAPAVHSLVRADTAVWAGTANGVARFNPADSMWVSEGLSGEPVFSMRFDGQRLWAGTRQRVYQNDGSGWTAQSVFSIYTKYTINSNKAEVRGLQPMPDGSVYVGVSEAVAERRGGHLIWLDGVNLKNFQVNGPPMNVITRLSFDVDRSLWASSASFGVGKLHPSGVWLNYNSASGDVNLTNRFTNLAFLADSQGSKWFSTLSFSATPKPLDELRDGLDLDVSNDVWVHHSIGSGGGDGLGSLRNVGAREDPGGNIWFLSDEVEAAAGWWGINIFNQARTAWRQVNPLTTDTTGTNAAMKSGDITDVAFGPFGEVFVALKTFGVQRWFTNGYQEADLFDLGNDAWLTIGEIGKLNEFSSTADILSLALRDDGVLWIGTSAGLYRWEGSLRPTPIVADRGFGTGLLGNVVRDLVLDRDNNLWVATELGLNRINFFDESDIASFTTAAVWQEQLSLFVPVDAVSPIVDASCNALALHPTQNRLFIATNGGLSILDLASLEPQATVLSTVYVYPNPILASRGHRTLKIFNVNSPVSVRIYTLEGELVHEEPNVSNSEDVVWDLKTDAGLLAASGVYLVRISDGSGTLIKRVSLIQ